MNYKDELKKMNLNELTSEKIKQFAKAAKIQLSPFFNPSSIALVGASRRQNAPGWVIFKNLIDNKREGKLKAKVYGVNIKGGELFGEPLYKSLLDIGDVIDHVIIAVPNKFVPNVMEDAGKKGAKVVTIITSGFSEVGNVELEKQVSEIAKKYDIRIIGPNGLGLLDTYTGVDTLFLPPHKSDRDGKPLLSTPRPPAGYITFLSQSGALGAAVLDYMFGEKMGLSKFISAGNKIDVDEIDVLLYSLEDPTTRVIMLYVEGIKGRGDLLVKIGKYVAREKPIVAIKGGRTSAGARAAASHTASIAGNAKIYEAAFREMGAIFANELIDFLDIAKAMAFLPPGGGTNIGIVTNGGGAGILASDCAEMIGLKVLPFHDRAMKIIHGYVEDGTIPNIATFANPIDLSAEGTDESYIAAVETLLEEPTIEGLVVITLHQTPNVTPHFPEKLAMVVHRYKKPVTIVDIGGAEMATWFRSEFDKYGLPSYPTPERAVKALKSLIDYGLWLKREGIFEDFLERWKRPEIEKVAPVPPTK
ncbi:MAG: acetate--CoA ligase family protein [Candidatus Njordarchaeia archaeon]